MRYSFDDEGIHQRYGVIFKKEINLTYARIQDIHLTSGVIQRWFGLADIQIQTASGSAGAEMTIVGIPEFEELRDFLYGKMRGVRKVGEAQPAKAVPQEVDDLHGGETVELLEDILSEIKAARVALEKQKPKA